MPRTGSDTALTFHVDDHPLALESSSVREILRMVELNAVPEMPAFLCGFLAIRDRVVPILDLGWFFRGEQPHPIPKDPAELLNQNIVLCQCGDRTLGWVCTAPHLLTYRANELFPLPSDHIMNRCCEWIIATRQGLSFPLIEPERLLLEEERARVATLTQRMAERLAALAASS